MFQKRFIFVPPKINIHPFSNKNMKKIQLKGGKEK